ncbi:MAG TPA: prephenate dehydratase domain-containing protein, partial [Capillimicrobium sp.]
HPQGTAQCARFLRERLPQASVVATPSTADAVRMVVEEGDGTWAAIGSRLAAELYGARVLRDDVQDGEGNATRFVWLGRDGAAPVGGGPRHKTSIVFWGGGDTTPGWLVECLGELSSRGVNMTRIESRPRRLGLGQYMFFVDVDGAQDDGDVGGALRALERHCEGLRVLGSYPAAPRDAEAARDRRAGR